jgi:hypothetical protein
VKTASERKRWDSIQRHHDSTQILLLISVSDTADFGPPPAPTAEEPDPEPEPVPIQEHSDY